MTNVNYADIAARHNLSPAAVEALAQALSRGGGMEAQFNHPDLGGKGHWIPGDIAIEDANNRVLKNRISRVCEELAARYRTVSVPAVTTRQSRWWDAAYGRADLSGEIAGVRYAFFRATRRLLVQREDTIQIYDTGDHTLIALLTDSSEAAESLVFETEGGSVQVRDLSPVSR